MPLISPLMPVPHLKNKSLSTYVIVAQYPMCKCTHLVTGFNELVGDQRRLSQSIVQHETIVQLRRHYIQPHSNSLSATQATELRSKGGGVVIGLRS